MSAVAIIAVIRAQTTDVMAASQVRWCGDIISRFLVVDHPAGKQSAAVVIPRRLSHGRDPPTIGIPGFVERTAGRLAVSATPDRAQTAPPFRRE
jgi:hypothetical protein